MQPNFSRPPTISPKLWKLLDPSEVSASISSIIERVKPGKENTSADIREMHTRLLENLEQLTYLASEHLSWFREQDFHDLIRLMDTAQPASTTWEQHRQYAFQLEENLSYIQQMLRQAHSAALFAVTLNNKKY